MKHSHTPDDANPSKRGLGSHPENKGPGWLPTNLDPAGAERPPTASTVTPAGFLPRIPAEIDLCDMCNRATLISELVRTTTEGLICWGCVEHIRDLGLDR